MADHSTNLPPAPLIPPHGAAWLTVGMIADEGKSPTYGVSMLRPLYSVWYRFRVLKQLYLDRIGSIVACASDEQVVDSDPCEPCHIVAHREREPQ